MIHLYKKLYQYYLIVIAMTIAAATVHAQDAPSSDCNTRYQKALGLYNQGNIDEAIKELAPCVGEEGRAMAMLDKTDKANVYWLLTRAYALRKKTAKSEVVYRKMLEYRPRFTPNSNELEDIQLMHQRLLVQPMRAFYVTGGVMQSFEHLRRRLNILAPADGATSQKEYSFPKPRHLIGLGVYQKLSKNSQLHVEFQQWNQVINYQQQIGKEVLRYNIVEVLQPVNRQDTLGYANYALSIENNHQQQFSYLSLPVFLRFVLPASRTLQLYAEAGGYFSLLTKVTHTVDINESDRLTTFDWDTKEATVYLSEKSSNNVISAEKLFMPYSIGYIAGAGLRLFIANKWYLGVGVRYQHSLLNVTDQEDRFLENNLLSHYDVPDDFSINSLSVQGTLEFPIRYKTYNYKTKKIGR